MFVVDTTVVTLNGALEQQYSDNSCTTRQCCDWVIAIRPYHRNAMINIMVSTVTTDEYTYGVEFPSFVK